MSAMKRLWIFTIVILAVVVQTIPAIAQLSKNSRWLSGLSAKYEVQPNVVYSTIDTLSDRLDLYVPRNAAKPSPVLIWIHGGGWGRLSKDSISGQILPYLEYGWVVVNVDYRLTPVALAPAAVQDCRCVLRWLARNAKQFNIDLQRIVVSGSSAGGHLALMTGMLPAKVVYDTLCAGTATPSVAAIVNHYGITDVNDLLAGPNRKGYAVNWIGDRVGKETIARIVSPMTFVRKDLPPIFTVQGDADPTVPYSHSVRLHAALDSVGVQNELMTIPGGKHGRFTKEENEEIRKRIEAFLLKHRILIEN
jgi:acetyl esterase/lipase